MAGKIVLDSDVDTDSNLRSNGMSGIEQGRTLHTVVFSECQAGLGIKVIGGIAEDDEDDKDFGIFIKKVLPGGVAALDGRLQEGDQLIEVNGQNLQRVTNEQAVHCLRQASASDYIQLVLCRDHQAREEYIELLNNYSYSSASSVYEQSSPVVDLLVHGSKDALGIPEGQAQSSRSITPTNHIRTPKSPVNFNKVPVESSSASEMDYTSPRYRPSSLPQYPSANVQADQSYLGTQSLPRVPKVPNAAAASMHGMMAPTLSSTPQQYMDRRRGARRRNKHRPVATVEGSMPNIKYSPPDGASGTASSQSNLTYEPSPVTASDTNIFKPAMLLSDMSQGMSYHSYAGDSQAYPPPPLSRKLSLEPNVRLPVEKLEVALRYLGLEPTVEQRSELRRRLKLDRYGVVLYGDFVRAAREVFNYELEQRGITPAALYLASPNFTENIMQGTSPVQPMQNPVYNNLPLEQEVERVRRERDQLRLEVERLKVLLREKEEACNLTEDDMLRVRKETQSALHENRALKTKLYLAEHAQKAARHMEQDYAEVVKLLEKELAQLKTQAPKSSDNTQIQKRLAVLGCQLRKTEVSKKTYEVATDKLLSFVELVHDTLSGKGGPLQPKDLNRDPPSTSSRHDGKLTTQQLAAEAKDTIKAVRTLLEAEPLPFGWEEAYTNDGAKYFINHVTQTTMWHHPVSKVQPTGSLPPQTLPPGEYQVNPPTPNKQSGDKYKTETLPSKDVSSKGKSPLNGVKKDKVIKVSPKEIKKSKKAETST